MAARDEANAGRLVDVGSGYYNLKVKPTSAFPSVRIGIPTSCSRTVTVTKKNQSGNS
jgi:hypothetical protein